MTQHQQQQKPPSCRKQGGSSYVFRSPSQQTGGSVMVKRPKSTLSQKQVEYVKLKYNRQKIILDMIHSKNPSKSGLFGKIIQLKPGQSVMKDLGDIDLLSLIVNHPQIADKNVDRIIKQLIDAFITMYKTGVVHLDIKPENIMTDYSPHTEPKPINIAFVDFAESITKWDIEDIFDKFRKCGTFNYVSPQLMDRLASRQRSSYTKGTWDEYVANDLWSLGVVVYLLLYGRMPVDVYSYRTKQRTTLPAMFVELTRKPHYHEALFPRFVDPRKQKYMTDLKALLSMNPQDRLEWLHKKLNQQKQTLKLKQQKQTSKLKQQKQTSKLKQQKQKLNQQQQEQQHIRKKHKI